MGGLVAALILASRGMAVTVVEKAQRPGGKLRVVHAGGREVDSGPTVFTMRPVFEAIFAQVGARLGERLSLTPASILARHSWEDGSTLDLFADRARSRAAIAALSGEDEARRFGAFCRRADEVFGTLDASFMRNPAPSPLGLARDAGLGGLAALTRIRPFSSLWSVMGSYFHDARLRQLFGRYATYCGSSPFLAPGPLMLIAAVEQAGVWLVEGGMPRLVEAIETLARQRGVEFCYGRAVARICAGRNVVAGVELEGGETLAADAVVFNGDPMALTSGLLGPDVSGALDAWPAAARSLSALTFSLDAMVDGFPLSRHTVFFSRDYAREFDDILVREKLPEEPTIYVCAQDRGAADARPPTGPERLLILVNAPARADTKPLSPMEIETCRNRVMERLGRAGLSIAPGDCVTTSPSDFADLFPATGGALYGRASHGWAASFQRPGARTKVAGLFLAGGGVHPGPGLPMAALSGSHAAAATLSHLASIARSPRTAIAGGMSMPSATTGGTR